MKKLFSKAIRSAAVATIATLSLGLGAGVANAQPALPEIPNLPIPSPVPHGDGPKQMVVFGDSFTANAGKSGPRGLAPAVAPWLPNCATDMENWPKIAAADLNKTLGDWSCNGTGGMPVAQLVAYVESAIAYGDIGPGTEKVVLMYGGMDAFQWVDVAGEMKILPGDATNPTIYRDTIRHVADRVRAVAPGAEIVLASYPEFATDDQLCLVNFADRVNPIPTPGATDIQRAFRDSIKHAAEYNNAKFVDVYEATIGHGTCAPRNEDRWVTGAIDPVSGPMPNHPTVHGEYAMARIIADALR
ncbi:GDSL-type esterase/lipase family protein [Corynebacterium pseudopelargi]|uniref:Lipase 2 n=1 Tax=Corynebacterium pseudopelargi TaxID=2080757 RepID=A0A3G6IYY5_9CORY|nr:GDSL-type esterase/lipase family protein [Corynebacterium pseudopelargi]AZA09888.1 Lipase 2 precursor [Corynebacterium pseudopelargi]